MRVAIVGIIGIRPFITKNSLENSQRLKRSFMRDKGVWKIQSDHTSGGSCRPINKVGSYTHHKQLEKGAHTCMLLLCHLRCHASSASWSSQVKLVPMPHPCGCTLHLLISVSVSLPLPEYKRGPPLLKTYATLSLPSRLPLCFKHCVSYYFHT